MTKELYDTLKIIDEKIKSTKQENVFISIREFPWYNERNGQLTKLFEAGLITKPVFYDDGASLRLTTKGKEYLKIHHEAVGEKKPSVFISYNWGSERIADEIEKKIEPYAQVKRDKSSVKPWGNLIEFMNSIRKQDFAVLIISDKYLKSAACMYEAMQLMKDDYWLDRAMFVVTEDAKVYDVLEQVKNIEYWDNKCQELQSALSQLRPATTVKQSEELQKYEFIKYNISNFMSSIAAVSNPDITKVINAIVSKLIASTVSEGETNCPPPTNMNDI